MGNGNKHELQPVYRGLNGFELSLTFNNSDPRYPSRFGRRWRDSFDRLITVSGTIAIAFRQDGNASRFVPAGGGWVPDADTNDRLTELKDSQGTRTGWQLTVAAGDETETYDASGKLLSIHSRAGLTQTLIYSDGTGGANGGFLLDPDGQPTTTPLPAGQLIRVLDNFGRTLSFGYDASVHVSKMVDPAGATYRFSYLTARNLVSITFPDTAVRTFVYNEPANTGGANLPNALTGITDENNARFATFQYDARERAVSTEHAGGAQRYTLSYGAGSTTVTDPLVTARTYAFQNILDALKNTSISGPACPSCGPASQSFDANGNLISKTDFNDNQTCYAYDTVRNLETVRVEGLASTVSCTAVTAAGAVLPAGSRKISTVWHPTFRLPAKVAEPLRITSYVYNGDGGASCGFQADGVTRVPGVLCSKTIQATTDATGAEGITATQTGTPRTWSHTYNANGSVLTMDGPRTDVSDVTTYTYYANNDADLGKRGNVATITNALGHPTSITAYNAHGQPLTIVDPNGLTTNLAYDERQRLKSRNVGGELTSYDYDGVGQLKKVTLPDGSFLSYSYDDAHRLKGMTDNLNNSIAYTLDDMGNRRVEEVRDPAMALAQTRTRVFNNLNQLFQELGAQSQTTTYGYDNQGNLISIDGPLAGTADTTVNAYDALNRLKQVTDPNNGVTRYGYDGIDQLVSVTDPRNLATTYNIDGLANLNSQASPDTGSTINTYDAAGNLRTQKDAKNQITTYVYDALNRVTSITFHDGSKQTYAYDLGPNGIGRLSSITETNPQNQVTSLIAYGYDQHGRTLSETRTINGVAYALGYSYDSAGRLSGMTYPSGRTIAYGFDPLGRINQVSTTPQGGTAQVVASSIAYQPFGGVKSYTLGNGQSYTRGYDTDGRIASYSLGSQVFTLNYDEASRIRMISDAANMNTYDYDLLDRLKSAVLPNLPFAYDYDAVGNRKLKTVGSVTDTYVYGTTSNRLASVTPQGGAARNFSFDPNGSTTADGNNTYVYDTRGRMFQSIGALGTTTYQVNALGQRIRKTNTTDDRVFLYDTRGRLIAETDPGGTLRREYLYLNDIPLVVFQ